VASHAGDTESGADRGGPEELPRGCRQQLVGLANLGLLLSIGFALISFLPMDWPWLHVSEVRLGSGGAVALFLVMSFGLAGWLGSALGIVLMAMAMVFGAFVGRMLGLVGMALSALMGVMVLLLILSDLPVLSAAGGNGRLGSRRMVVWIGLAADLIIGVLVWVMLRRF
jgi:hypothetical protein